MITVTSPQTTDQELSFKGLSTDTKPNSTYDGKAIPNGSTFYEMDTGNIYMYDKESSTWLLQ